MGNLCSRRHRHIQHDDEDEDAWVVVQNAHVPNPIHRRRFQRAVRRIKHLLRLRKIWSRAGSWLNTAAARNPRNARMRTIMVHIFTHWPLTVLRNSKRIFEHLRRERGRLVYVR